MKVVLLKDVANVGKEGEVVNVKSGYGNNFLIKKGLAVKGTKENIEKAKAHQAELAKQREEARQAAIDLAKKLDESQLIIKERAADDGVLFGSVTNKNIAEHLEADLGLVVDKRKIDMPEVIRNVGHFTVKIKTAPGVIGKLTVIVTEK
ncbi:50S ribosomal protein L9 [uncultured Pseudoramibacter sp.]|uniref:50S ribosomal protein L9 n=1 Tax=uncultured Pseudoramibacter sp. TaxID=1623493 RepID=UPI0025CC6F67|nr:50S ribosomal protein L9 [uncultured Pseudoramibacter sp.]